jgi:hypothetical protein
MKEGDSVSVEWGDIKIDGILINLYEASADIKIAGDRTVNYELEYVHKKRYKLADNSGKENV